MNFFDFLTENFQYLHKFILIIYQSSLTNQYSGFNFLIIRVLFREKTNGYISVSPEFLQFIFLNRNLTKDLKKMVAVLKQIWNTELNIFQ